MLMNLLQPLIDSEQWTLEQLHAIGIGWGLCIVVLTLLVRAGTIPLTMKTMRAQRDLQLHAPELKALRERHKHDRERLQKETLAYYQEHKINPLGPLAPMLVQIPIFISLYYLMRSDVKTGLFGDDGFLFIPQLTEQPHGAVAVTLLITYATTQLITAQLSTRMMQGTQKKLMMGLPLLFAGIVLRFPAGLAIYWLTSGFWSLGQRVMINRSMPAPALATTTAAAPSALSETPPAHSSPAPRPARRDNRKKRKRKRRR